MGWGGGARSGNASVCGAVRECRRFTRRSGVADGGLADGGQAARGRAPVRMLPLGLPSARDAPVKASALLTLSVQKISPLWM